MLKKLKKVIYCWVNSYLCAVMKKILLFFTIAGSLFFLNTLCAHDVKLESGFKMTQPDNAVGYGSSGRANSTIDYFFSYISDDDTNDSEREKVSSGKTSHTNTYFAPQNFAEICFKKILPTKIFRAFCTKLFLFNGVLRI